MSCFNKNVAQLRPFATPAANFVVSPIARTASTGKLAPAIVGQMLPTQSKMVLERNPGAMGENGFGRLGSAGPLHPPGGKWQAAAPTDQHLSHSGGDAAILARLIRPRNDDLPAAAAKAFLNIRIEGDELVRLQDLLVRNQDGQLSPAEKADLESYLHVSAFLDLPSRFHGQG